MHLWDHHKRNDFDKLCFQSVWISNQRPQQPNKYRFYCHRRYPILHQNFPLSYTCCNAHECIHLQKDVDHLLTTLQILRIMNVRKMHQSLTESNLFTKYCYFHSNEWHKYYNTSLMYMILTFLSFCSPWILLYKLKHSCFEWIDKDISKYYKSDFNKPSKRKFLNDHWK